MSYASVIENMMYAQVCTRPDLAFITGMLGRYQSNPGLDHWKAAKKALRYLQGTKGLMLTYKRSDNLEVVGYSDADFAGCVDTKNPHQVISSPSQKELYRGKAPSKVSLHRQQCRLNLWHVMRQPGRQYG